jgi:NADPH2:quinone reductase
MSRAVVVESLGGPEVLRCVERPPRELAAGEVRVAMRAIGVNYIDVYFRTGLYPQRLPFVPGMEGCGEVEAVAPDVRRFRRGDRVAWAGVQGSYAELVNVPAERAVLVPDPVSDDVAAAVMLQGMTAHYLTFATRTTHPGDVCVVHAAAGGVGLLLIQLLARAGARVIGICSSDEKEKLARGAGAHDVLRYTDPPFDQEVRRLTSGRGADVVYDSVGRETFQGSLKALRPRGMLVLYGQSSGPVPPFDLGLLNVHGSLFLTRPSLAHYTLDRAELELRAGALFSAIAAGQLDVRIGARFPLAEAEAAHRALEGRQTTGKVLLIP